MSQEDAVSGEEMIAEESPQEAGGEVSGQPESPAGEASEGGDGKAPGTPGSKLEELESALAAAKAEAAEQYDRYLRAVAELDNFRKRTARIRVETREDTLRDVLLSLAPVMDNLRRALSHESEDAASLRQGVELIQQQLTTVLDGYGLRAIEAVGRPFDPNLHDAMMEIERDDCEPGTVVEETERGYMLNEKVVRPARVIVSKSSE